MQSKWNDATFFIIRGIDNAGLGMRNQPLPFITEKEGDQVSMERNQDYVQKQDHKTNKYIPTTENINK